MLEFIHNLLVNRRESRRRSSDKELPIRWTDAHLLIDPRYFFLIEEEVLTRRLGLDVGTFANGISIRINNKRQWYLIGKDKVIGEMLAWIRNAENRPVITFTDEVLTIERPA